MSDVVKLSSRLLADEDLNGLDAYAKTLIAGQVIVAVVALDCPTVTRITDTGQEVPTARVRWIEPLGEMHDVPQSVRELVTRQRETRTGRTPIPFLSLDGHEVSVEDYVPAHQPVLGEDGEE